MRYNRNPRYDTKDINTKYYIYIILNDVAY